LSSDRLRVNEIYFNKCQAILNRFFSIGWRRWSSRCWQRFGWYHIVQLWPVR